MPDEAAIARDVLSERSNDLVFATSEWDSTVAEISAVLGQVRTALPVAANSHALELRPFKIEMEISGPYVDGLLEENPGDQGTLVGPPVGDPALDAFIDQLGPTEVVVNWYRNPAVAVLQVCMNMRVNTQITIGEFAQLEHASNVMPIYSGIYLDRPTLDMRKRDDAWFVVVREAAGDCPSGCIYVKHWFFRVTSGTVEQINEAQALADPLFAALAERVDIQNPPWPSIPTPAPMTPTTSHVAFAPSTPGQLPAAGGSPVATDSSRAVLLFSGSLLVASISGFLLARRR